MTVNFLKSQCIVSKNTICATQRVTCHLHISNQVTHCLIKTIQTASTVLWLESRLGVKIRVRYDEYHSSETCSCRKHNMQMRASSADAIIAIFTVQNRSTTNGRTTIIYHYYHTTTVIICLIQDPARTKRVSRARNITKVANSKRKHPVL